MKTTIEVEGYQITIETDENAISVSAMKDEDVVEEFTLSLGEEGQSLPDDDEDGEVQGFDEFSDEEEDFDSEEEDLEDADEDIEDAEEDLDDAEEDLEDAEEDIDDAEEDVEKEKEAKMESFQTFFNKKSPSRRPAPKRRGR